MRSSLNTFLLAFSAASMLATPSLAAEQRCTDLGTTCTCSEPLLFTEAVPAGVFDPSDTTGTSQCNGGRAIDTSQPLRTVPANSLLGDALPGVPRVLEVATGNGGNMFDRDRDFTNSTYCVRNYTMYSTNHRNPRSTDRVKGPRNEDTSGLPIPHPGFETSSSNFGAVNPSMDFQPQGNHGTPFGAVAGNGSLKPLGDTLTFESCKGHWCRWEQCYDHNVNGQQRLNFRARVTRLSDGKVFLYGPEASVGTSPTATSGTSSFPVNFFEQGYTSNEGFSYYSHVMTAIKRPADGSFWIGGASEIEGAGVVVTPPPTGGTTSGSTGGTTSGTTGGTTGGTTTGGTTTAGNTGLPFTDNFESGSSNWPHSNMSLTTNRAFSGSWSAAGAAVSGATDSTWLLHYWGDANAVSGGDISCTTACPGGRTNEVYFRTKFFIEGSSSLVTAAPYTLHRKIALVGSFSSWNSTFGTNQNNSAYYFSIPVGNFNSSPGLDLAFNSWRRHDNAGNQVADILDSAQANDVINPNTWYDLEVRAKLNSLGQADGVLQIWLNGAKVIDRVNMNFRGGYDASTWNYVMLSDNGDGPSSGTVRFFWDDVKIDTAPIGTSSGGGTSTTPLAPPILLEIVPAVP